ncbi:MAG: hypothetical protein BGP10_17030 [Rhodanobacter sp. 68-29]|nr:hypothetical protein [Rhodanobacter sp.]ODU73461.1 MAG: hypothetical protein ABT17_11540 [Rhodanobacter sp. SCN 69-32]OJY55920.1 MAG: hypothetical protein BGP10_17030 [Rhodanobacter sp. 68-29]
MGYYWRARNIPELQEVQPADRHEWWQVARGSVWRGWIQWICVAAGALAYVGARQLDGTLHLNPFAGLLVVLVAAGLVGGSFEFFCVQPRARRWLREHLHEFRTDDGDAGATGAVRR